MYIKIKKVWPLIKGQFPICRMLARVPVPGPSSCWGPGVCLPQPEATEWPKWLQSLTADTRGEPRPPKWTLNVSRNIRQAEKRQASKNPSIRASMPQVPKVGGRGGSPTLPPRSLPRNYLDCKTDFLSFALANSLQKQPIWFALAVIHAKSNGVHGKHNALVCFCCNFQCIWVWSDDAVPCKTPPSTFWAMRMKTAACFSLRLIMRMKTAAEVLEKLAEGLVDSHSRQYMYVVNYLQYIYIYISIYNVICIYILNIYIYVCGEYMYIYMCIYNIVHTYGTVYVPTYVRHCIFKESCWFPRGTFSALPYSPPRPI